MSCRTISPVSSAVASNAQTLDRLIECRDIRVGELAKRLAKSKRLDPPTQIDDQRLDIFARNRPHFDAAIRLGDQQPFLSQLQQGVSNRSSTDAVLLGQGLLRADSCLRPVCRRSRPRESGRPLAREWYDKRASFFTQKSSLFRTEDRMLRPSRIYESTSSARASPTQRSVLATSILYTISNFRQASVRMHLPRKPRSNRYNAGTPEEKAVLQYREPRQRQGNLDHDEPDDATKVSSTIQRNSDAGCYQFDPPAVHTFGAPVDQTLTLASSDAAAS